MLTCDNCVKQDVCAIKETYAKLYTKVQVPTDKENNFTTIVNCKRFYSIPLSDYKEMLKD